MAYPFFSGASPGSRLSCRLLSCRWRWALSLALPFSALLSPTLRTGCFRWPHGTAPAVGAACMLIPLLSPQQNFAPFPGHALKGASFWGSLMFVFYTGLHIDKDHFLGEHATRQFWIISLTSLFMPLLLGCFAGWIFLDFLYGDYLVGKGSRATYILSLGISAGVTALPVLSAILLEVGACKPATSTHRRTINLQLSV